HWLPPDNFQEDPRPVVAHRTSPTNTGLLLLSTVAAHDFGYLGTLELIERLELTCATLNQLPRFHGHFFNWYDTRTLAPLQPQYISTVDSGNLAGHLLAVKQACIELADRALFDAGTLRGLADTVALLNEEAARLGSVRQRTEVVTVKHLRNELDACTQLVTGAQPETLSGWAKLFAALTGRALVLEDIVGALAQEHGAESFAELRFWLSALQRQTQNLARDLHVVAHETFILAAQLTSRLNFLPAELVARWTETARELERVTTPARAVERYEEALTQLDALRAESKREAATNAPEQVAAREALELLSRSLEEAARATRTLIERAGELAQVCTHIFNEMDFKFLLDPERKVFVIGYNVTAGRCDNSYYDLLASEARLASFIAIAKGAVPQEHWFRLGRQLTPVDGGRALISWTATMFEYLMPLLVMRDYERTLLDETYHAIVARQIEYGSERRIPWGFSEAAY